MTSLAYKIFEFGLRRTKFRDGMLRDMRRGNHRHALPTGKLKQRYERSEFAGQAVWRVDPKSGPSDHVYIHYHGGGFVYGILDVHYPTLCELADESGVSVLVPDYPLPPMSANDIHKWSYDYFETITSEYGLDYVTIGGCSAGGNLALAVLQLRRQAKRPNPDKCILWSPWVDLSHPEGAKPNGDKEPLITMKGIIPAGRNFAKNWDLKDPLISPIFMTFEGIPDLFVFTGQKDVLNPDIEIFMAKAHEAKILKQQFTEPNFGHYWMFYPTKDRHKTIRQTADIIKRRP